MYNCDVFNYKHGFTRVQCNVICSQTMMTSLRYDWNVEQVPMLTRSCETLTKKRTVHVQPRHEISKT